MYLKIGTVTSFDVDEMFGKTTLLLMWAFWWLQYSRQIPIAEYYI